MRTQLQHCMDKQLGVLLHLRGGHALPCVIRGLSGEMLWGKNQQYDHLVVPLDEVIAVAWNGQGLPADQSLLD